MHSGKRNRLRIPKDEQYDRISTELVSGNLIHTQSKLLYPDLNSSINFATTDKEAQINTKIGNPGNHVFKTESVAELKTLYTNGEVERTEVFNHPRKVCLWFSPKKS